MGSRFYRVLFYFLQTPREGTKRNNQESGLSRKKLSAGVHLQQQSVLPHPTKHRRAKKKKRLLAFACVCPWMDASVTEQQQWSAFYRLRLNLLGFFFLHFWQCICTVVRCSNLAWRVGDPLTLEVVSHLSVPRLLRLSRFVCKNYNICTQTPKDPPPHHHHHHRQPIDVSHWLFLLIFGVLNNRWSTAFLPLSYDRNVKCSQLRTQRWVIYYL